MPDYYHHAHRHGPPLEADEPRTVATSADAIERTPGASPREPIDASAADGAAERGADVYADRVASETIAIGIDAPIRFDGASARSDTSNGSPSIETFDLMPAASATDIDPPSAHVAVEPVLAQASEPTPADSAMDASAALSDLIALVGTFAADTPHREPMLPGRAAFPLIDPDDSDPLAALTREYQQALICEMQGCPYGLEVTPSSSSESVPAAMPTQPVFADHADPSTIDASVFDLLTKDKTIDTLLDSLDTFGAAQLFEADTPHEILSLLAPHGIPVRVAGQPAQLARAEHHMISVDSHMTMPDPTDHDDFDALDGNQR